MEKTISEKKSALRLINKYAESYSALEQENKQLKNEIKDLRLNLKINKEIIEGLYNSKNNTEKENLYNSKIAQETQNNREIIHKLKIEVEDLRYNLNYQAQCHSENMTFFRDENEKLKNKLFVIDNCIIKKDNIIAGLKKRLEAANILDIQITEPSKAVMQMNDELTLYKDLYSKLITNLNINRIMLAKQDKSINDLQNENTRLTKEINDRDKRKLEESMKEALDTTPKTAIRIGNLDNSVNKSDITATNISDNNLSKLNNTLKPLKKYYEYEEWWADALKNNNITILEFNKFKANKTFTRFVDLIEFLNNIIVDKNFQIRILEDELKNVSELNDTLMMKIANKKVNDSLDINLSNNSKFFFKKPLYFDNKKLITLSSISSNELKENVNDGGLFTITNESSSIEQINININVLN
jgi:hypothetical protein